MHDAVHASSLLPELMYVELIAPIEILQQQTTPSKQFVALTSIFLKGTRSTSNDIFSLTSIIMKDLEEGTKKTFEVNLDETVGELRAMLSERSGESPPPQLTKQKLCPEASSNSSTEVARHRYIPSHVPTLLVHYQPCLMCHHYLQTD